MRTGRAYRGLGAILLGATLLYVGVAAFSLRFALDHLLFPATPAFVGPSPASIFNIQGNSGNELIVRRYGEARLGCVVFFPGQHGAAASYSLTGYMSAGLAVLLIAYPGQDGAPGRTELGEIEHLVEEAIAMAGDSCPPRRMVFVGVSLGSMLAAYASGSVRPAGLVLISAAPSLSSAIRVRLRSRAFLAPLSLLPLSALLPHDYSLAESLSRSSGVPVHVFQGTSDAQTPVALLRNANTFREAVKLIEVPGGTHSTTFALSQARQISSIQGMLKDETL